MQCAQDPLDGGGLKVLQSHSFGPVDNDELDVNLDPGIPAARDQRGGIHSWRGRAGIPIVAGGGVVSWFSGHGPPDCPRPLFGC
jgi:hypothetical protein